MQRTHKKCPRCNEMCPIESFGFRKDRPTKLHAYCRKCKSERMKDWDAQHPGYHAKANRISRVKRLYGLTSEEAKAAEEKRTDPCPICGKIDPDDLLVLDHKHGDKFRDAICRNCNLALGYIDDDPKIAYALGQYLEKHKFKET